jgi:hypothetical protein
MCSCNTTIFDVSACRSRHHRPFEQRPRHLTSRTVPRGQRRHGRALFHGRMRPVGDRRPECVKHFLESVGGLVPERVPTRAQGRRPGLMAEGRSVGLSVRVARRSRMRNASEASSGRTNRPARTMKAPEPDRASCVSSAYESVMSPDEPPIRSTSVSREVVDAPLTLHVFMCGGKRRWRVTARMAHIFARRLFETAAASEVPAPSVRTYLASRIGFDPRCWLRS